MSSLGQLTTMFNIQRAEFSTSEKNFTLFLVEDLGANSARNLNARILETVDYFFIFEKIIMHYLAAKSPRNWIVVALQFTFTGRPHIAARSVP